MPPKSRIWRAAISWPGWSGRPGQSTSVDARVPGEELDDARGRWRSGAPCARRASSAPRSTSHASNGPGTAPSDFCRNRRRSAIVGSFVAGEAADDVRVAAEVLRRRVDDDVGAEVERRLEVRRRERVVDDEQRARRVRRRRDGRDVDDVQQRVRRRLDPDEPRARDVRRGVGRELAPASRT